MFDNEVWFVDNARYHDGSKSSGWVGKNAYNNKLVGTNITMANGETLDEWKAEDPKTHDVGSTYLNVPISGQSAAIISAARHLLSLPANDP